MKEYEEALKRIREYLGKPDMHIDIDVLDNLILDEFSKENRDMKVVDLALDAVVARRDYRVKMNNAKA